jgi:hypothetical protein
MSSGNGFVGLSPTDGQLLWEYSLKCDTRIVQPAQVDSSELLLSTSPRNGLFRMALTNTSGKWETTKRWRSSRLRPDFNDFVVHKGYVYGLDVSALACIDIENGKRKWKGERYGGQLILLAEQDLLFILSEQGDLVLASASPDMYKEIARIHAIGGKTWNHPVLVRDILLVRNSEEMVAFRL